MNRQLFAQTLAAVPTEAGLHSLLTAALDAFVSHTSAGATGAISLGVSRIGERTLLAYRRDSATPHASVASATLREPSSWSDVRSGRCDCAVELISDLGGAGARWLRKRGIEHLVTARAGDDLVHLGTAQGDDATLAGKLIAAGAILAPLLSQARASARAASATQATSAGPLAAPLTDRAIAPGTVVRPATILVVEDEQVVRDATVSLLQNAGHHVYAAAGAPEAWRLMQRHKETIDLVITDLIMPGENGADLAERLVQRWPGLRILFVSGFAGDLHDKIKVDSRRGFLQKPFTESRLLARVAAMLE